MDQESIKRRQKNAGEKHMEFRLIKRKRSETDRAVLHVWKKEAHYDDCFKGAGFHKK